MEEKKYFLLYLREYNLYIIEENNFCQSYNIILFIVKQNLIYNQFLFVENVLFWRYLSLLVYWQ